MKSLDKILELIKDSQWHSIKEIQKDLSLPDEKLNKIISFLQEQDFIDKENEKLKIASRGLKLLGLLGLPT